MAGGSAGAISTVLSTEDVKREAVVCREMQSGSSESASSMSKGLLKNKTVVTKPTAVYSSKLLGDVVKLASEIIGRRAECARAFAFFCETKFARGIFLDGAR